VAHSMAPWGQTRRLTVTRMRADNRAADQRRGALTWEELQELKDEYLGRETVAVEVYPPSSEVVNEAPTRHLWEIPAELAPSLIRR
jgi:hypothetical protein